MCFTTKKKKKKKKKEKKQKKEKEKKEKETHIKAKPEKFFCFKKNYICNSYARCMVFC